MSVDNLSKYSRNKRLIEIILPPILILYDEKFFPTYAWDKLPVDYFEQSAW